MLAADYADCAEKQRLQSAADVRRLAYLLRLVIIQFVLNELYMSQSSSSSAVQAEFVDRMGHGAESDGLSPIAGRLFGLLLISEAPLSLDDLAEALGVSKASISTEARRLLDRGIVERVSARGDRRDYYELAPDFFAQVIRSRVARWRKLHDLVNRVNLG